MKITNPVLRPGDTCWRIEKAERLSVIIDAADYFLALREVMQRAQHNIFMIGWEFDMRIDLDPRKVEEDVPHRLGKFLSWLISCRPDLNIYLLQWDVGLLATLGRGSTPLRLVDWFISQQIHMKLDHMHPHGATHHQKIIVIDDVLAFCGGIDVTADRWDTPEHQENSRFRIRPTSKRPYDPWHDATTVVDGRAAHTLGRLVRKRWETATGEKIPPTPAVQPLWPDCIEPMFRNVPVAISRTVPAHAGHAAIHEIEALYLSIIQSARHTLYFENQYFASRIIAEAIAARLAEPDGPEVVIINPVSARGWLAQKAMGAARARLLTLVQAADVYSRFKLYTPVASAGTPIYVHAKIVVMDDRLMRIGSSNLNNRSLGFDSECDLAVEVTEGMPHADDVRNSITDLRNTLLAEHLNVWRNTMRTAIETADGSLIVAIEALRGRGRSLLPFEPPDFGVIADSVLRENDLLDPESPSRWWQFS